MKSGKQLNVTKKHSKRSDLQRHLTINLWLIVGVMLGYIACLLTVGLLLLFY